MVSGKMRIGGLAIVGLTVAALASSALATTVVTDFSNFTLSGTYGSWADPATVFTSGPNDFRVESTGAWGGGFFDIEPNLDASGELTLELDVVLNPANEAGGVVVTLVDDDLTTYNYAWYSLTNGAQTLTADLATPLWISGAGTIPGLDLGTLSFFHIQGDSLGATDITWENMVLTPEPSGLLVVAIGALAVLRRRMV